MKPCFPEEDCSGMCAKTTAVTDILSERCFQATQVSRVSFKSFQHLSVDPAGYSLLLVIFSRSFRIYYLDFFCKEDLSLLHLFIDSIACLYQHGRTDICFIFWVRGVFRIGKHPRWIPSMEVVRKSVGAEEDTQCMEHSSWEWDPEGEALAKMRDTLY